MKFATTVVLSLLLIGACKKEETTSTPVSKPAPVSADEQKKQDLQLAAEAWSDKVTPAEAERLRDECTATAEVACVTLKVTGLAYLVGTKTDATRTLVVPKIPQHNTLLLTTPINRSTLADSGLLNQQKDQKKDGDTAFSQTFFFRQFPDAVEIDLESSGWTKPATPVLEADETGDPSAECPSRTIPKESLHWLPHLATVSKHTPAPTMADLDTDFTDKDPDDKKVTTRLEFVDGRLEVEMGGGGIGKFQFTRNGQLQPDDHKQAIATYLRYRFPAKMEDVTISGQTERNFVLRGRRFRGSDRKEVIARFKPDGNGHIEIVLANTVDFFFLKPPAKVEHLPHAYAIFKGSAVKPTVPVRVETCLGAPGASGVECGPLRVP